MNKVRCTFGDQIIPSDDLLEAEISIVRFAQHQRFKEEIDALSSAKSAVKRESLLYKLYPCMEDGLLSVEGRLSRAALPEKNQASTHSF